MKKKNLDRISVRQSLAVGLSRFYAVSAIGIILLQLYEL